MPENPSLSADERAELEAASGERGPARPGAPAARQRCRTVVAALLIMVAWCWPAWWSFHRSRGTHRRFSGAAVAELTSDRRRCYTTLHDSTAGGWAAPRGTGEAKVTVGGRSSLPETLQQLRHAQPHPVPRPNLASTSCLRCCLGPSGTGRCCEPPEHRWHARVRASWPLSPTTPSRVRCARCVPAASTGDRGLAAKLQVSRPTRDQAAGPSQGGSAGSNPVGATIRTPAQHGR